MTCNHCQNRPATKIVRWVGIEWAGEPEASTEYTIREGQVYCDECAELQLADRHRDSPTAEALPQ